MNAVLVWVLVSIGGYSGDQVVYSPPMQDLASCELVRTNIPNKYVQSHSRCMPIKMMVPK